MTTETPRAPVRISAKQNLWRYKSRAGTYEECMALYVTDLEGDLWECVELMAGLAHELTIYFNSGVLDRQTDLFILLERANSSLARYKD